jgi:hypothetical protein
VDNGQSKSKITAGNVGYPVKILKHAVEEVVPGVTGVNIRERGLKIKMTSSARRL